MSRRVAIFGGSFNPPHLGHQMVCLMALSVGGIDEVWLVPCFQHAFVKELEPFDHRLAMCRLATEVFGDRVRVTDVERRIGGVSRTLHTLRQLAQDHGTHQWTLLVGADILQECERWYGWDEITERADLFVVSRGAMPSPGSSTEDPVDEGGPPRSVVAVPDVSSTQIRERLGRGLSVDGLVPRAVAAYIAEHQLYRGTKAPPADPAGGA